MTANIGRINREDVVETVRPTGDHWQVILLHEPTRTLVRASDATDLLAKRKAWVMLRDKLEGLDG